MGLKIRSIEKFGLSFFIIFLIAAAVYFKNNSTSEHSDTHIVPRNENCKLENYIFGQKIEQTDPCLVSTFKKMMLIPPPTSDQVNPEKWNINSEIPANIEKFKWVEKLIIEQLPPEDEGKGFFIECGANDGFYISSTIRLEREFNWTGLLIEANPIPFRKLQARKRNAFLVNAALCTTRYPQPLVFHTYPRYTGASGLVKNKKYKNPVDVVVPCIPFFTMLLAMNLNTIDYLNLDIEGLELAILETLPFDKIKFKMMTVEYIHIPGKSKAVRDFLEQNEYRYVKDINDSSTTDSLYVHKSLYELAKSINI